MREKRHRGHFEIVDRLVWTLLRLGNTYKESFLAQRQASLTEAIKMIVGEVPLKSGQVDTPRGEKAYGKCFKDYKAVCHIMAALEFMRREGQERDVFSGLSTPPRIERFLQLSCWFREQLLSLQIPNIKNKSLFSEEVLVSLPPWVSAEEMDISIEPFPEKGNELRPQLIDPRMKG